MYNDNNDSLKINQINFILLQTEKTCLVKFS